MLRLDPSAVRSVPANRAAGADENHPPPCPVGLQARAVMQNAAMARVGFRKVDLPLVCPTWNIAHSD
jgi:hypothetical protein